MWSFIKFRQLVKSQETIVIKKNNLKITSNLRPRYISETAQLTNMGFAQLIGVVILQTLKLLF